jgi:alpha-1,3-rhamnosyltransferase
VPEVSVIMAVYNGERFLDEAIESVLNQTHRDFEFVIIDDGSTDRSASILAYYSRLDLRVTVIRQINQGPAAACNLALTNARNNLVAVLDADDRLLPTRLKRQIVFSQENPAASVICSYSYIIDAKGKRIGKSRNDVDVAAGIRDLDPSRFLEVVHPSVMMRRKDVLALCGYNGTLTPLEDRDLWGRMVTSGKLIECQREFLMEYRLHGASITMWNVFKPNVKGRSIDINVIRRLKGEPNLSLEEVKRLLDSRPLLQKCNQERKFLALMFYKNATRMYAEGNVLRFAVLIGVAMFLRPVNLLRRLLTKRSKR